MRNGSRHHRRRRHSDDRARGKPSLTRSSRKRTAYHEAGHATIGRVLTLYSGGVTIKPDFDQGCVGCCITADPYDCIFEWERRGKVRTDSAVWHARIITFMAGAETETELLGRACGGDGNDRFWIDRMMDEVSPPDWNKRETRLRAMTRMLVRRHRARIERVAKALLAKTTLSARQVDRLVGRSVADVRVNAPFLLAMAAGSKPRSLECP